MTEVNIFVKEVDEYYNVRLYEVKSGNLFSGTILKAPYVDDSQDFCEAIEHGYSQDDRMNMSKIISRIYAVNKIY